MKADLHSVARCTGRSAGNLLLRLSPEGRLRARHFRHSECGFIHWSLVWLLCAVAFSACDFRPSAPESRAAYFVEKFIVAPQAEDDLRGMARLDADQSPETLANDLPTRATVAYLRARHRLGAELGFHAAGTVRSATGHKVVKVMVSESTAVPVKDAAVRFEVELENQDQAWLVVRLKAN